MKKIYYDLEDYVEDDYITIVNDFVDFFASKYGNVISLYQIGSAGFPSVSDLDLAIIIDEKILNKTTIQSIIKDANEFVYKNKARRYIFTHSTLKYPIKTFSHNQYFEYMPSSTLLYGKEVRLETEEIDKPIIDDIMFIIYEANTLRDFERLRKKSHVGMRELLKVYQRAYYHLSRSSYKQNKNLNVEEMFQMAQYVKKVRLNASKKVLDHTHENDLITLFNDLYDMVSKSYTNQIALLSKKITGQYIDKEVYVFGSGGLVKQPLFLLYMGALYGKVFEKEGNCYASIHKWIYPLDISSLNFDPAYIKIIQKQAEILNPVCSFYKRFGVKVSGPLLCYYCKPDVTKKTKIRYTLQKQFYKIQGLKVI